jgi:hypothetical protein
MHGPSFAGNAAVALRALADNYDHRIHDCVPTAAAA